MESKRLENKFSIITNMDSAVSGLPINLQATGIPQGFPTVGQRQIIPDIGLVLSILKYNKYF